MKTLREIREQHPSGVTLRLLCLDVYPDDRSMWEAYLTGGMDPELMSIVDSLVAPPVRAAAGLCHGYIQEFRVAMEEIREVRKLLDSLLDGLVE